MSAPSGGTGDESTDARVKWVALAGVPEEIEANLAAGFLENEGIQCVIESNYFSQEPTNLSLLGQFVLFVHEDSLDRARSLLKDRLDLSKSEPNSKDLDSLLNEEE